VPQQRAHLYSEGYRANDNDGDECRNHHIMHAGPFLRVCDAAGRGSSQPRVL
jgi:hypothetical protein